MNSENYTGWNSLDPRRNSSCILRNCCRNPKWNLYRFWEQTAARVLNKPLEESQKKLPEMNFWRKMEEIPGVSPGRIPGGISKDIPGGIWSKFLWNDKTPASIPEEIFGEFPEEISGVFTEFLHEYWNPGGIPEGTSGRIPDKTSKNFILLFPSYSQQRATVE